MSGLDYRSAGVDLDIYEQAMKRLPGLMESTRTPGVIDLPGGFAGLFQLSAVRSWKDPVLVSGTDGVGTKLRVAIDAGICDSVGIDLVAMCVNDCLCLGAVPLFFLDYIAMDADDPDLLEQLVRGVTEGCRQAGTALLGGETAIMPDMYAAGDFDLSGFCVGAVERDELIDGRTRIRSEDAIIGLPSTGFHSNGFSLIRKVVFDHAGLTVQDRPEEFGGRTVADVLLTPTRIYARQMAAVLEQVGNRQIHGVAHITGGGLAENIARILPNGLTAEIDRSTWTPSPVFAWLQRLGNIEPAEMDRVFNGGLGLVLVVDAAAADAVCQAATGPDGPACVIGRIRQSQTDDGPRVRLCG